jgi:hypothetical protein
MSAQVQSGSPGRLGICTVSGDPSSRTSSLTLTGLPLPPWNQPLFLAITMTPSGKLPRGGPKSLTISLVEGNTPYIEGNPPAACSTI